MNKFDVLNEEATFDLMMDDFLSGKDIEEKWGVKDVKRFKDAVLATYKLEIKFGEESKILTPNKTEQIAFNMKFHFTDNEWRIMKNTSSKDKVIIGKGISVNDMVKGFNQEIGGKDFKIRLKK